MAPFPADAAAPGSRVRRAAAWATLVTALALIAVATLTPQSAAAEPIGHWCLVCGRFGTADVVANIILFTPLGIGLAGVGAGWRRTVAASALISTTIELLQLHVIAGRYSTLSDVVTNSAGGAIGAALVVWWPLLRAPSPRSSRRLLASSLALWLLVLGVGAWALAPDVRGDERDPTPSPFPYTPGFGWFEGDVSGASVDGVTFGHRGSGAVIVQGTLRERTDVDVSAVGGDRRSGFIPMLFVPMLFVHRPNDTTAVIMLGTLRTRGDFRIRLRSARLRLREPTVMVDGVPDRLAGARPYSLTGHRRRDSLTIVLTDSRGTRQNTLRLSPTLSWSLLSPYPRADYPPFAVPGTVAWLAALAAPLGYFAWCAASGANTAADRWLGPAAVGLVVAVGLGVLPRVTGHEPLAWWEWSATAGGVVLGAVAARLRGVRRPEKAAAVRSQPASTNRTRPSTSS